MKKSLLVTLADKNYIEQAKQLFSSAYWNAGWKGDYMLLAHEIPEKNLSWFRNKGILVKKCKPINNNELPKTFPIIFLDKFYLFTPEFKKWDNVVYLDADIIVRYSIKELAKVSGFYAIPDLFNSFKDQFHLIGPKDIFFDELRKKFKLNAPSFNAGVMAFSTDIITDNSFNKLSDLLLMYHKNSTFHDQSIFNLYFYNHWKKLSNIYNIFLSFWIKYFLSKPYKIDGIILHFFKSDKPWIPDNPFYKEWGKNLQRADLIDLNYTRPDPRIFARGKMIIYSSYFNIMKIILGFYYYIDRKIGSFGIFLKKHRPDLYFKLKNIRK